MPQRGPKSVKEEAEFGPGRKEIVFCSGCGIVYYHKAWHHAFEDWRHFDEDKPVKFVLCPACRMIQDKKFEGELIISGINKKELKDEIIGALRSGGELAFRRDPLDRVIGIEDKKNQLIIRTTENQLAVRLGKKIRQTFHGQMEIIHSRGEDVTRVKVTL